LVARVGEEGLMGVCIIFEVQHRSNQFFKGSSTQTSPILRVQILSEAHEDPEYEHCE